MDFDTMQLLTVGGVLLILIGMLVYNQQRAAKARTHTTTVGSPTTPATTPETWPGRYVHHAGSVVGRVVAVEENRLIIERAGERRAFATSQARPAGADIELTGEFDWEAAKKVGVVVEGERGSENE